MKPIRTKILHITPWYPTPEKPHVAVWIKRHIDLLSAQFDQHILHIQLEWGSKPNERYEEEGFTRLCVYVPFKSWRLREWLFRIALARELRHLRARHSFDTVNFHIAYPALIFYKALKPLLPKRTLLTEHWSAYHFQFHAVRGLSRLRKMFQHSIPLVAVSQALVKDIEHFSQTTQQASVVPNVVDTALFRPTDAAKQGWLMLGVWSGPKDPMQVLDDFLEAPDHHRTPLLKIGGAGHKWIDIENKVLNHRNKHRVILLGQLSTDQLITELQTSEGLLLPTSYETFSVITAEALCTGCPVITHAVGALPELLGHDWPGYKTTHESWLEAIGRMQQSNFPLASLTKKTRALCSPEHVTQLYTAAITSLP